MNNETFDQIADRIKELTKNSVASVAFDDMKLVSYDENTHHAVIQVRDLVNRDYIKRNCTHEVIEAFDSVLGVETTVSCIYEKPKRKEPHERFIM